jgi:putative phosphoesterase
MTISQALTLKPQRIAILADIHGNTLALDAALSEIDRAGGVDGYWFLGDYVAIGFDPLGVMERIGRLPNAVFVRGNTDRLAVSLDEMDPWLAEVEDDPEIWPMLIRINRSFAWTAGAMVTSGWHDWLSDLPLERRFTLPDGTRVLLVHASPGTDDGIGIHPKLSDEELGALIEGAEADLILIGHTHAPLDRQVNGIRVVNPGSIGNPVLPGAGACYALLQTGPHGYELTLHQAAYDKEAAMIATDAVKHPAAEYIKRFLEGRRVPDWAQE